MTTRFQQSRTYATDPQTAYDVVRKAALPEMFRRRYGPFPPILEVRGQIGEWGTAVGQSRTIVLSDGGTIKETLTEIDEPRSFGYRMSDLTGRMKPLATGLTGRWEVAPDADRTLVTWTWDVEARSRLTAPILPVLRVFWNRYAARGLAEADRLMAT